MTGRLLCLEGGEGAGKTEQVGRLARHLGDRGLDVVLTREPGGTPNAEEIRALFKRVRDEPYLPLTELLLVMAARADHLDRLVRPALARGAVVVCDRFLDSTIVYQGILRGLGEGFVRDLHDRVLGGLAPDLTLVLDLPVPDALARAGRRGAVAEDAFDGEAAEFHERIRGGFLSLADADPARHRVVDAAGTPEEVAARVRAEVDAFLGAQKA